MKSTMALVLPLAAITMGIASSTAFGQVVSRPTYQINKPSPTVVTSYCSEMRFQSYINLSVAMRDYVTPYEYSELYLPLKIKAAKAQMTLKNYGPLSNHTHKALMDIVIFVNENETKFSALWEVEAFFKVAMDLMDMTQTLARDLQ